MVSLWLQLLHVRAAGANNGESGRECCVPGTGFRGRCEPLTSVMGAELCFSAAEEHTLNHLAISPALLEF